MGKIDDEFILERVKTNCEAHMESLWPGFSEKFEYIGWKGGVLAKCSTNSEFRASIVFQDPEKVIYIFPGKISNIFSAGHEVRELIDGGYSTVEKNGCSYLTDGRLAMGLAELSAPTIEENSTCLLQTYSDILKESAPYQGEEKKYYQDKVESTLKPISLVPSRKFLLRFATSFLILEGLKHLIIAPGENRPELIGVEILMALAYAACDDNFVQHKFKLVESTVINPSVTLFSSTRRKKHPEAEKEEGLPYTKKTL